MSDIYLDRLRTAWDALSAAEREHSLRVAQWAVVLGSRLGLSAEMLHLLGHGAILHDVGKAYL